MRHISTQNTSIPNFFKPEPKWHIEFNRKLIKSFDKDIRYKVGETIEALKKHGNHLTHEELKELGFIIDSRKNVNQFHNHIIQNNTTYVANWEFDKKNKHIELVGLGSHENFKFEKK